MDTKKIIIEAIDKEDLKLKIEKEIEKMSLEGAFKIVDVKSSAVGNKIKAEIIFATIED